MATEELRTFAKVECSLKSFVRQNETNANLTDNNEITSLLISPRKKSDHFAAFFREQKEEFGEFVRGIVDYVEKDLGLPHYILRICGNDFGNKGKELDRNLNFTRDIWNIFPETRQSKKWFLFIEGRKEMKGVKVTDPMSELTDEDPIPFEEISFLKFTPGAFEEALKEEKVPLELKMKDLAIEEDDVKNHKVFLDANGRPTYVVVLKEAKGVLGETIALQSELKDEHLQSLWEEVVKASFNFERRWERQTKDNFICIDINAGNYQRVRHIHFKVFMAAAKFNPPLEKRETVKKLKDFCDYQGEVWKKVQELAKKV